MFLKTYMAMTEWLLPIKNKINDNKDDSMLSILSYLRSGNYIEAIIAIWRPYCTKSGQTDI